MLMWPSVTFINHLFVLFFVTFLSESCTVTLPTSSCYFQSFIDLFADTTNTHRHRKIPRLFLFSVAGNNKFHEKALIQIQQDYRELELNIGELLF